MLAIPLPPGMDDAAVAAAFPLDRCIAMIRAAAGRPDLEVELLATSTFAFAAQVAARYRAGRVVLVGDAAHRMTPRGGRGMNTAIADGHALGWRLAWILTGRADPALLDTYEVERAPIGRRNVEMSMVPGGGGTDDGLLEDLGPIVASAAIVPETGAPATDPTPAPATTYVPSARPGARAPHVWIDLDGERCSTLDLVGDDLVLLVAGEGRAWTAAVDGGRLRGPRAGRRHHDGRLRRGLRPGDRRGGPRPARRHRRLAGRDGTRRAGRRPGRRRRGHHRAERRPIHLAGRLTGGRHRAPKESPTMTTTRWASLLAALTYLAIGIGGIIPTRPAIRR